MDNIRVYDARVLPGDSAFLIDDGETAVLYDSGFGFTGPALVRKLEDLLQGRSLDYIFLTHSHYDHISGVCNFKNAIIHISKAEYDYLQLKSNPHNKFLGDVIEFLNYKNNLGNLNLIDQEYSNDNITCKVVGGHTVGSMLVVIEDLLFTGDSIFLLDSIENNLPIGFSNEEKNSLRALELCQKHKGIILTGHDFNCIDSL